MQKHRFLKRSLAPYTWLSLTLAATPVALAGEVADLVTFMPGTPARASEVNDNFTAIRTAVNDNHARLTVAESSQHDTDESLQALQSASASQAAQLSSLQSASASQAAQLSSLQNELAAVRAELRAPGVISVPAHAFTSYSGYACSYGVGTDVGTFQGPVGADCPASAPVHLPHGAQITAVRCTSVDRADGRINSFGLRAMNLDNAAATVSPWWGYENQEPLSGAPYLVVASLTSGTPSALIDNSVKSYSLSLTATAGTDSARLSVLGCRIHYAFPE